VRRALLAAALLLLALAAIYFFLIRDSVVAPDVAVPEAVATIGTGEDAVAVTASGAAVVWLPLAHEPQLPQLPLAAVPKGGRVKGPALEQVRVLAAAPPALRPYLAGSYFGESGVDVETTAGIELRFGDASQASRKWKAAAAVLADPEIEALDYVDLHAPAHPAIGGSGHTLPPSP
jgi:hypothetical protein